jgi:hypothetical protein
MKSGLWRTSCLRQKRRSDDAVPGLAPPVIPPGLDFTFQSWRTISSPCVCRNTPLKIDGDVPESHLPEFAAHRSLAAGACPPFTT